MALNYGRRVSDPLYLQQNQIGSEHKQEPKKKNHHTSLWRMIIDGIVLAAGIALAAATLGTASAATAAGAAMIAGDIATEAAATSAVAIADATEVGSFFGELGINAVAAGANTGLSAQEGNLNAAGEAINWGTSIIPFGGQARSVVKATKGAARLAAETGSSAVKMSENLSKRAIIAAQKKSELKIAKMTTGGAARINKQSLKAEKQFNKMSELFEGMQDGTINYTKRRGKTISKYLGENSADQQKTYNKLRGGVKRGQNQAKDLNAKTAVRSKGQTQAKYKLDVQKNSLKKVQSRKGKTPRIHSNTGRNGAEVAANNTYIGEKFSYKGQAIKADIAAKRAGLQKNIGKVREATNKKIGNIKRRTVAIEKLVGEVSNYSFVKVFSRASTKRNMTLDAMKLGLDKSTRELIIKEATGVMYNSTKDLATVSSRAANSVINSSLNKEDKILFNALSTDVRKQFLGMRKGLNVNGIKKVDEISIEEVLKLQRESFKSDNVDVILKSMTEEGRATINDTVKTFGYDNLDSFFYELHMRDSVVGEKKWNRTMRYLGSGENWEGKKGKGFNRRFVQRLQLIDPNDQGRALIEYMYQKFSTKLEDKMFVVNEEEAMAKAAAKKESKPYANGLRKAKKVAKKGKRIEKELEDFKDSGGVLIKSSYLMGYKILDTRGKNNIVLMRFHEATTSTSKGKNKGGKKAIIIQATDYDLKQLKQNGSKYWFAVGRRKGWFMSRGGHKLGFKGAQVGKALTMFLSFVPIPALKNMLSIVSNWVENTADLVRGDYLKHYLNKLTGSLTRSALSRTSRFSTRKVIGGYAKKAFGTRIGGSISRELQRVSTILFSAGQGKGKGSFGFKFNSSGYLNRVRSKAMLGAATSFKGEMARVGSVNRMWDKGIGKWKSTKESKRVDRKIKASMNPGRKRIGTRRNLSQLTRPWSAVTPSGTVNLRKLTKF